MLFVESLLQLHLCEFCVMECFLGIKTSVMLGVGVHAWVVCKRDMSVKERHFYS
jgi:hypothetical protein